MTQLWNIDYNDYTKNKDLKWQHCSRTNRYVYVTPDGVKDIYDFCKIYQPKSILDYGCGLNYSYAKDGSPQKKFNDNNIIVIRYDPFIEEYSTRPSQASDIVICNNVLNAIEPDFFDDVMEDIYNLTNKAVICNIIVPGLYKLTAEDFIKKIAKSKFTIKEFTYKTLNEWKNIVGCVIDDSDNAPNKKGLKVLYMLLEK